MIRINNKYLNGFKSKSRYFIITGGRGSGKSFSLNVLLLLLTYEAGHTILFTRYTMISALISIIPEFLEKIELMEAFSDFQITRNEIINVKSGSKIIFKGLKTGSGFQTASLKSVTGVTTWVLDEAEELQDENIFDKIDLTVRQKDKHNRVILVLNPATKEHFIYKRFFESRGISEGQNITKEDTTYIHTTYLDNVDNLSESYLNQLENIRTRRPEKYKHQILGGWLDKAEGVIFTNWTIGTFVSVGTSVFGQDFGFSTDPTTLVETSIDKSNKRIYVKLHLYKQAMTTTDIYNHDNIIVGTKLIVADSAEPRLISELKSKGLNIVPIKKTEITFGIALLQDYDLIIDQDSLELIKEINNYAWMDSKKSTPIDKWNHGIDALRYAVTHQLINPHSGQYHIS